LGDESVRNLSVEDTVTVDPVVPHKGARILAEIMENFDNVSIFENLLQSMRERVELSEIKDEAAVGTQANLYHRKAKVSISNLIISLPR
jgi:hypothetical protein